VFFKRPILQLPKIKAPTAAELAPKINPQPAAQSLLKPEMTPAEYLGVLEENKLSNDAVNLLANGMPERESTWWACQSSRKVADKLNPEDTAALAAAEAWVKHPTYDTGAAAAAAAAKTDFSGPGGWAAQAAAWSQEAAQAAKAAEGAKAAAAAPNLTASAVAGAVLLAAGLTKRPAMPAANKPVIEMPALESLPLPPLETPAATTVIPPVDQDKLAKLLQPFIDLGKDVASGKNSWA
jgi:hypothetical protein